MPKKQNNRFLEWLKNKGLVQIKTGNKDYLRRQVISRKEKQNGVPVVNSVKFTPVKKLRQSMERLLTKTNTLTEFDKWMEKQGVMTAEGSGIFNPTHGRRKNKKIKPFWKADMRLSVKAIIEDKDGNILVLKDAYTDYFDLPGGHVDADETLEDALEREVKEETGMRISSSKQIDWTPVVTIGEDKHPVYFYRVKANGKIKLSKEHTHYIWINKEMVDVLNLGAFRDIILVALDGKI